ncbi:MAG: hypothetical protein FWH57_12055 [Oscillospiraceae bacterium]|nr:hypothetical protein [Oscillospiraceae bacterium]
MRMIAQSVTVIQQEVLKNVLSNIPVVLVCSENEAFILIKDLHEELENFILTGRISANEISIFHSAYERELIAQWRSAGFECKYRNQSLEYMHHKVTIKYIQVSNPQTNMKVSILPWFLLSGRPYPIFAYVYAIWHYINSEQKSMQLSAAVVREIFGISSFHKSTLSRNIRAMEQLISDFQMDKPLFVEEPDTLSVADVVSRIPDLLNNCPTIESLTKACGVKTGRLPLPIRHTDVLSYALSPIPQKLSKVIKSLAPVRKQSRDLRKRPSRNRAKKYRLVQRTLVFEESWRIKQIRLEFIAVCKNIVLDAAITYHRFII